MATIKKIGIKGSDGDYAYRDIAVEVGNVEGLSDYLAAATIGTAAVATTATNATNDGAGRDIQSTYIKNITKSGNSIVMVKGDGTESAPLSVGQVYSTFTDNSDGLVPAPGSSSNLKFLRSDGTWGDTSIAPFSTGSSGVVPAPGAGDAQKFLRGDATWAEVSTRNDTYTSGAGITVGLADASYSHELSLTSGVLTTGTAGAAYGPNQNKTQTSGQNVTVAIPQVTVDTYGRVTAIASYDLTVIDTLPTSNIPTNHSSTATTYGAGNATDYGHVKLSDSYKTNSGSAAAGVGASSKAVFDAWTELNSRIIALETGDVILPIYSSSATNTPTTNGAIWIVE